MKSSYFSNISRGPGALALWAALILAGCAEGIAPVAPGQEPEPAPEATPEGTPEPEGEPEDDGPVCGDGVCDEGELGACAEDCAVGSKCEVDADCGAGRLCIDAACIEGDCRQNEDCPSAGHTCVGNQCTSNQPPRIVAFSVDPEIVVAGEQATLRWEADFADEARIIATPASQSIGDVEASGSRDIAGVETVSFRLEVSNASGEISQEVTLQVLPRLEIVSPPEGPLPEATVGELYEARFEARGGQGQRRWVLEGALPEGMSFDPVAGIFSGSPTRSGLYDMLVRVLDEGGQQAERAISLQVTATLLEIATEALPDAPVGQPYAVTLAARGGQAPLDWSLAQGSLPDGLSLSPEGVISGSPTTVGSRIFILELRDGAAQVARATRSIRVTPPALAFAFDALPEGRAGEAYDMTLQAVGGVPPYQFIVSGVLPSGLNLFGDRLRGTPTEALETTLTVQLRDATNAEIFDDFPLTILPASLTIASASLPEGRVGQAYSAALLASGGRPPLVWSAQGLPAGLSMSPGGALSGQPQEHGDFAVAVAVESGDGQLAATELALRISPPLLVITSASLPEGRAGQAYSAALEATGGLAPLVWSARGLPAGLTIDGGGAVAGIPEVSGAFSVEVEVADDFGQVARRPLALTLAPRAPEVVTASLPTATLQAPYSVALEGRFGQVPYSWTITSGALPAGLALQSGVISGSPQVLGQFPIVVRLTDARAELSEASLTLLVAPTPLVIATASLPAAQVGQPYSAALASSGGAPPVTWRVAQGSLPAGLSLSEAGVISGTPSQLGSFSITFEAADQAAQVVSAALTLSVAAGVLDVTTATLPSGRQGEPYAAQLAVAGGQAPFDWRVESGALPQGVSLSASGLLSGTPAVSGGFSFSVRVTDARQSVGTRALTLSVDPPVVPEVIHAAIAGSFVDISATGQRLTISDQDDGVTGALALGFSFEFFGDAFTQIFVDSNGLVGFESSASSITNSSIPSLDGPENIIAPFWDDLDPGDNGDVFFEVRGAAPFRRAIVQWKDVDFFLGNDTRLNFEVILYETTDQIQILYGVSTQGDIEPGRALGNSATIGIESADGLQGVEIAFNQAAAALPGQILLLTPAEGGYELDGWSALDDDFENIGTTGTLATSITGDDSLQQLPIGFDFRYFGATHSQLFATSNGLLAFDSVGATAFSNAAMPSGATPNGLIAPFWDDLIIGVNSRVLSQTLGTAPRRRFIVQWDKIERLGVVNTQLTFQAVLFETSNHIAFRYGPMTFPSDPVGFQGASATVGIENAGGTLGAELSFNTANITQGASAVFLPASGVDTTSYEAVGLSTGFIDIQRVGARLSTTDGLDDASIAQAIGFDFDFYGQRFSAVEVSTNGFIRFGGAQGASSFTNQTIPGLGSPDGMLAPFWDDLDPSEDGNRGRIFVHTRGVAPLREFIVQWQSMPHNLDASASMTFQVVLSEADGSAIFHYGSMLGGTGAFHNASSATIGVESLDGAQGALHGFNQAAAVRAGGQVRIFPILR